MSGAAPEFICSTFAALRPADAVTRNSKARSLLLWICAGLAIAAVPIALYFSGAFFTARGAARPGCEGASVLLVSVDTLRLDALGCYNKSIASTPNIDKFAAESVVFDQAIAASNYTAPSHATMLTGASPAVHGVFNSVLSTPRKIPTTLATLAEKLKNRGYDTRADTGGGYVIPAFGFDRGFDIFTSEYCPTDAKITAAIEWFASRPAGRSGFYFLHTYEAHAPYLPEQAEAERIYQRFRGSTIRDRVKEILAFSPDQRLSRGHGILFKDSKKLTDDDIYDLRILYSNAVARIDAAFGRLVDGLRGKRLLDRTIVILASDHGEEFREHNNLQHESIYDEVARVPLCVRLPGGVQAGRRVSITFPAVNLTPTILDMLGIETPNNVDGRSRADLLYGNEFGALDEVAFASYFSGEEILGHAARTPRLKLLKLYSTLKRDATRYFDLRGDPRELKPQLNSPRADFRDLERRLNAETSLWNTLRAIFAPGAATGQLNDRELNDLKNIGYLK